MIIFTKLQNKIQHVYINLKAKIQSFINEDFTVYRLALPISRSYRKEVLKILKNF